MAKRVIQTTERWVERFGPAYPRTKISDYAIAELVEKGDLDAAQQRAERVLVVMENVFGPDRLRTADSLSDLAAVHFGKGAAAAARLFEERALAINEKVLGPDDPTTATSLATLVLLLLQEGKFETARPLAERAVATCTKVFGLDDPTTVASLNNLALLQSQKALDALASPHSRVLEYQSSQTEQPFLIGGSALVQDDELSVLHDLDSEIDLSEARRLLAAAHKLGFTFEGALQALQAAAEAARETTGRAKAKARVESAPIAAPVEKSSRRKPRYVFTEEELHDPIEIDRARDTLSDIETIRSRGQPIPDEKRLAGNRAKAFIRKIRQLDGPT